MTVQDNEHKQVFMKSHHREFGCGIKWVLMLKYWVVVGVVLMLPFSSVRGSATYVYSFTTKLTSDQSV